MNPKKLFPLFVTDKLAETKAFYVEKAGFEINVDMDQYLSVRYGDKDGHRVEDTALFSLSYRVSPEVRANVGVLRKAVDDRSKVHLDYADATGTPSGRVVCPLGLYFWGSVWTLGAWCELRQDF